jgi:hypothetical protein
MGSAEFRLGENRRAGNGEDSRGRVADVEGGAIWHGLS